MSEVCPLIRVPSRASRAAQILYRRAVQTACLHLDQIASDRAAPKNVCDACVAIGSRWVHLRQCLTCGETNCCDSSPNRHATKHFHASAHPIMKNLEPGQDWAWCFVDRLTLVEDVDGRWRTTDPFFDSGLAFAQEALAAGEQLPFAPTASSREGFPLGVWETTFRGRHRAGTLDPDQEAALESLPGWRW
jgi:Zn-finger in ubiquitin-hydrolases and other protein